MTTRDAVATELVHEVKESRHTKGEWVVEMIDHGSEGEVHVAIFSGPQARECAEEYAVWKNERSGSIV